MTTLAAPVTSATTLSADIRSALGRLKRGVFLTQLDARSVPNSKDWVLLAPLVYWPAGWTDVLAVPAGFVTDLASVPRVLPLAHALFGDRARRAAALHDYLYTVCRMPRDRCDALFHEAMLSSGIDRFSAFAMWAGVRIGGGAYYGIRRV
jgi:hypothetical protein